jgi:hypothetical protein
VAKTITSANSVFSLSAPDALAAPFNVQGYAADDAFDNEEVEVAQTVMGVDGKMSAAFVPFMTPMTITLQADSPSIDQFEAILGTMQATTEAIFVQGAIVLPSVQRAYTLGNGVLTRVKQIPPAKKRLEPVQYQITWESVTPSPQL